MSAGLPYLQKLRKSDLSELAETSKLPNYEALKKADLEVALDEHLRANQTTYATEASLSDYYKRLGARSPAKKSTSDVAKSEGEAVVKKVRRKTQTVAEQAAAATSEAEGTMSSLIKTPGREISRVSSNLASQIPLPPSPAVVTDAIDRQTRRLSLVVAKAYSQIGLTESADTARDVLSSPSVITLLALLVEALSLRTTILPSKIAGEIPAIPYIADSKTSVYLPDLFLLLDASFWTPFSLWTLTSLIIPLACAYFFNFPLKHIPGHGHATRRAAAIHARPSLQFDPVVFNVAKAITAYVVYAQHYNLMGLYSHVAVTTVNESMLGGYVGIMTGAGVAVLISLYDAVLRK